MCSIHCSISLGASPIYFSWVLYFPVLNLSNAFKAAHEGSITFVVPQVISLSFWGLLEFE